MGCCREFAGNSNESEGDIAEGAVRPRLQAEFDRVTRGKLEIADGFIGDQHAVWRCRQKGKSRGGVAIAEIGVRHGGGAGNGCGVDAVEFLQVVSDIGEAVHHRLGLHDARRVSHRREEGAGGHHGGAGDGDIGAIGQHRVDARLLLVSCVEDGRRDSEGKGQRQQGHAAH